MEAISINGSLWIRVQPHQINFDYEGLPENVHFTIAFNKQSEYINLHLSKNVKGIPSYDKPQIRICSISKKDFELLLPEIGLNFLKSILEEIDIAVDTYSNSYIIPFDVLETESSEGNIESLFVNAFKPVTKVKKGKKISIKGDIEEKISEVATSSEIQDIILSSKEVFNPNDFENLKGGLIINNTTESIGVIKINGKWYKMNFLANPVNYLEILIGEELTRNLVEYTRKSIKYIEALNNKEECKKYENSIHFQCIEKK